MQILLPNSSQHRPMQNDCSPSWEFRFYCCRLLSVIKTSIASALALLSMVAIGVGICSDYNLAALGAPWLEWLVLLCAAVLLAVNEGFQVNLVITTRQSRQVKHAILTSIASTRTRTNAHLFPSCVNRSAC